MSQYAFFSLRSDVRPPDEINRLLAFDADVSQLKGSKRTDPPLPRCHHWEVMATRQSAVVDDQLREIIDRLRPVTVRIRGLVEDGSCSATLQVVRRFNDPEGEEENLEPLDTEIGVLEHIPGQHQLLGWHIDPEIVDFLIATGAEIDIDEYG